MAGILLKHKEAINQFRIFFYNTCQSWQKVAISQRSLLDVLGLKKLSQSCAMLAIYHWLGHLKEVICSVSFCQMNPLKSCWVWRIFRVNKDKVIFQLLFSKMSKNWLKLTTIVEILSYSFRYLLNGDVVGAIRSNASFDKNFLFLCRMSLSDLTFDELTLVHVLTVLNRYFKFFCALYALSSCWLI